jgi:integrase
MACIRKRRGKWVVDYRDGAGKRRWITTDTRRAAEDALAKILPETRQWTLPTMDTQITLGAYGVRWLSVIKPTVKPRTFVSYQQTLCQHIEPAFGGMQLRRLHRSQIKLFLVKKLESGRLDATHAGKGGGLSRNSVRIIHATLRVMLKAAVEDGILTVNPAEKLGRLLHLGTSKQGRQERIKAMTREQRFAFLEAAARVTPRYYHLLWTLAGTGLRLGEVLTLQWGDLDVRAREIRVSRIISRGAIETPKAGHGRTVDLSHTLTAALSTHEIERKAETLRRGLEAVPAWMFWRDDGQLFDESGVRKAMRRALKAAQVPLHFSPHCLRHTYASLLLQQGESPAYVQRQLGHASIQLTVDTYGKWLPIGNKAAIDRLDAPPARESGSKTVAVGDNKGSGEAQVIEIDGGPCRGRTYGPLIKSEYPGMAQRPINWAIPAPVAEIRPYAV